MFITVTCSEEKMFYHCKNESRKLEVCGQEYFVSAFGPMRPCPSEFQNFPEPLT